MKTYVMIDDKRWVGVPLEEIAKSALKLLVDNSLVKKSNFEVSILAGNDSEIKKLNKNFRGRNTSTNIISWPEYNLQPKHPGHSPKQFDKSTLASEETIFLGNLAISFERCSSEAEKKDISFADHLLHLLLHGYLHLLGFDHQNELDATLMEDIEIRLLSRIGIKNPYELND